MRSGMKLFTIALILSNVGCASIGIRTGVYKNQCAIYPATVNDAGTVCYAAALPFRTSLDPAFMPDAQDGLVYVFAPVAIIDFPLAVALDTVFLPFDIHKLLKRRRDDSGFVPYESPQQRPSLFRRQQVNPDGGRLSAEEIHGH